MITELGAWVTETACTQAKVWRDAGHCDFILAVNLSPYQLRTDCTTRLKEIFRESGFPAEFFEFEVTETLLVGDDGSSLQQLADMRTELGLRITMDDFGTGHSSLSQLKLLPIGKLKIDRSFINDLPDDQNDAAIVKAIILMAHTLGLEVVAEGWRQKPSSVSSAIVNATICRAFCTAGPCRRKQSATCLDAARCVLNDYATRNDTSVRPRLVSTLARIAQWYPAAVHCRSGAGQQV
ncbi:MAG: EAL domain-containing protein [Chromatiaceae bacterium]|nr:EAL domain-containing protein [Chromatiaceae bacterium]